MKKYFLLLISVFLLFSCGTKGLMEITVTPDKDNIVAGDTVGFSVELPEKEKFVDGDYFVYDKHDVQMFSDKIEEGKFEYQFTLAGNYKIRARALSKKDYGEKVITVDVVVSMDIPEWSLVDSGNPTSIMAGDKFSCNLQDLQTIDNVSSIDVRIFDADNLKSVYFEKNIGDTISWQTYNPRNIGNYEIIIVLKDSLGNMGVMRDSFSVLDPNNPIIITINPSQDNPSYKNKVYVEGEIKSDLAAVTEVKLVRRAYYGREDGIYPLSEPKVDGGVDYDKYGIDLPVSEEIYYAKIKDSDPESLLKYDEENEKWTFEDPMNYYYFDSEGNVKEDEEGNKIKEEGFTWSYAKLDREAWKYIKRKKYFDFKKVMEIEYQLFVKNENTKPGKDGTKTAVRKGFPFLDKKAMAQVIMWNKEVAMNRLWHMQVPRYCWSNSVSWLKTAQDVAGGYSGKIYYSVSGLSGSGNLDNYSDFPGVTVGLNDPLSVSVTVYTNYMQAHKLNMFLVLPLYGRVDCKIDIGVRDYVLQWGLWANNDQPLASVEIKRNGFDTQELNFTDLKSFMPIYKDEWVPYPGYGYDENDFSSGELAPETWTRINFYYPPEPNGGGWKYSNWSDKNDTEWKMHYEVE